MPILLAGCFGGIHLASAEEAVYPGHPGHPGYAAYRRISALRMGRPSGDLGDSEQGKPLYVAYESVLIKLIQNMDGRGVGRKAVLDRIKEHPEEVNDWWSHDGWSGTPLTEAMKKKGQGNSVLAFGERSDSISASGRIFLEECGGGKPGICGDPGCHSAGAKKAPCLYERLVFGYVPHASFTMILRAGEAAAARAACLVLCQRNAESMMQPAVCLNMGKWHKKLFLLYSLPFSFPFPCQKPGMMVNDKGGEVWKPWQGAGCPQRD